MLQKTMNLFFLIFLFSCAHQSSQWIDPKESESGEVNYDINIPVKSLTLDNGLRVLLVANKDLPIFSYYTFYDVGGRYEQKGTTGATHFLEHLMFKGAKKYGPGKFDTIIEGNGGSTNAYTTFDSTVYYENLPIESLETIIDLEADRMSSLIIDPKTFESERQVVLEERKLRYENRPGGKLYLNTMKAMFKGTPYGGSVIGDYEDVANLKIEEVRSFFKKFYAPNNAVLVIVGDLDVSRTMDLVKKYYGPLERSKNLEDFKKPFDSEKNFSFRGEVKKSLKIHSTSPSPMFMMAFRAHKLGDENSYVLDLLAAILGNGQSSYLNQKYVTGKKPLLSYIRSSNYTLKHNGIFYIMGQLLKKTNLTTFKRNLGKRLVGYCDKAITERSVQKAKNQFLISYYRELDTNSGVAHFVGERENFFNDFNHYKKELSIYKNITADQIKQSCKKLFIGNKSLFASVWEKHPRKK
ncbi:MAG: M16 family metallopeptidase [Bacteriovoracaceae bacterium]